MTKKVEKFMNFKIKNLNFEKILFKIEKIKKINDSLVNSLIKVNQNQLLNSEI